MLMRSQFNAVRARRKLLFVLFSAALLLALSLASCSSAENSDVQQTVSRVVAHMQAAESYHVAISSLAGSSPVGGAAVDVDYQRPDKFHAITHDQQTNDESIWTDRLFVRTCHQQDCENWSQGQPRTSPDSLGRSVPGVPLLPLLALMSLESAHASDMGQEIQISGYFDFVKALGGQSSPDECREEQFGPLGPSAVPSVTCLRANNTQDTYRYSIDVWVDSNTLLVKRANVHTGGIGDLLYENSRYGNVSVVDPQ